MFYFYFVHNVGMYLPKYNYLIKKFENSSHNNNKTVNIGTYFNCKQYFWYCYLSVSIVCLVKIKISNIKKY